MLTVTSRRVWLLILDRYPQYALRLANISNPLHGILAVAKFCSLMLLCNHYLDPEILYLETI